MTMPFEILTRGTVKEAEQRRKSLCLVLLFLLLAELCQAQEARRTDILLKRAQGIEDFMKKNYEVNPLLKYGKEYRHKYPNIDGSQFYGGKVLDHWTLIYDGITFNQVTLRYDNYNGFVLTPVVPGTHTNFLILDNTRISKFTIGSRQFVSVGNTLGPVLEEGIYELAFDGTHSRLLIARLKRLHSPVYRESGELDKFISSNKYYLQTPHGIFRIASKKDLLQNLDNEPELKTFIKQNRLKLKTSKPESGSEIHAGSEPLRNFEFG